MRKFIFLFLFLVGLLVGSVPAAFASPFTYTATFDGSQVLCWGYYAIVDIPVIAPSDGIYTLTITNVNLSSYSGMVFVAVVPDGNDCWNGYLTYATYPLIPL